ncbi:MAG: S1 RNA-binding domain-containing protein [Armatimonadetes bacterium]|nr:S1 RNA-binding domain-containing protein [Armatimonadota bacterium]
MTIDEHLTPQTAADSSTETATPDQTATDKPVASTVEAPAAAKKPAKREAAETRAEPDPDDMALFEAALSAMEGGDDDGGTFKKLSKGDRVEATIIQVENDRLFVDVGTKSEGIVPFNELTNDNITSAKDHFKVGDKIQVVVLRPEGQEGNPIVSKKRADFEEVWDRIEHAFHDKTMINAQIVDRVKGGLVADVGVRGFVPATHVGNGKQRNLEKYLGQPMALKVIEIDRDRKKVVLSNREAEEERRANVKEEIFKSVKPGDVLDGTVRRLTDYGAFVDLGGVDGLLHISEMSWMRIAHPREMLKEGQKIQVMVLRLDEGAGKISLGHRQVLPDPWTLIAQNYKIGQKMMVTIGRMVQSGVFIKLPEGAEAFMPLSEMSYRRVRRPEDVVTEGQEIEVQVIDLRGDERRMVLSMRAAGSVPAPAAGDAVPSDYEEDSLRSGPDRGRGGPGAKKKSGGKSGPRRGRDDSDFDESALRRGSFSGSGATIGERLGMLKGFFGRDEDEEVEEKKGDDETE